MLINLCMYVHACVCECIFIPFFASTKIFFEYYKISMLSFSPLIKKYKFLNLLLFSSTTCGLIVYSCPTCGYHRILLGRLLCNHLTFMPWRNVIGKRVSVATPWVEDVHGHGGYIHIVYTIHLVSYTEQVGLLRYKVICS